MTDALYATEIKRHLLGLREALVRHDENLAADELLQRCVPFFLLDDPEVAQAREDQRQMVLHIRDPEAYEHYYGGGNVHERPFEEQYGIKPEEAHQALHRLAFLRERLERRMVDGLTARDPDPEPEVFVDRAKVRVLDLSANDGFMAVNLGELGYRVHCVDLHPGNCALAVERMKAGAKGIAAVHCADLHLIAEKGLGIPEGGWDAVVCFETVEHVPDPDETLAAMVRLCADGGRLYVSTPLEAVERGNLPNWAHVEPKGHVRVFRSRDFEALLERHGEIKRFEIGPDRVMVAEVAPKP